MDASQGRADRSRVVTPANNPLRRSRHLQLSAFSATGVFKVSAKPVVSPM